MTARCALWLMIGVSALLRLAWAASLGGYTNEAYYFLYARHLDWGFFDHPPMVGAVAAVGLKLAGWVSPELGLRLGFIAMFAGSSWLLARITARWFGEWAGVMAVVALNATVFYGLKIGTFADPDGPLLFFWLLTLDRLWVALEDPDRIKAWLGVGLAWGGALCSKYYAVLIPVGACLYLLVRPEPRRCLRRPGPYLAAVVGLLVFSPVIGWNAAHEWASFAFQGGRAGRFHGLQPKMFLEALVGQILYLTPWIWLRLVWVLFGLGRRHRRDWSGPEAFVLSQALPALGLFLGVATFQRIMPHWPLIGFVALLPVLGRAWAQNLAESPRRFGFKLAVVTAVPFVFASLFIVHARTGLFQDARGRLFGRFSPDLDPSVDTIRWEQTARALERRGLLEEPRTFLFTDHWLLSAELAMAVPSDEPVACYHRDARSFTFWSRPEEWVGRDAIYVRMHDGPAEPGDYIPWFTRIEPLTSFPIVRAGAVLETVYLYRCVQQSAPFAFGYNGPGPMPLPANATEEQRLAVRRSRAARPSR